MQQARVAQVNLRGFDEPLADIAEKRGQTADEKRLLQNVEMPCDGMMRHAERRAKRGGVEHPALGVGEHGEQSAQEKWVGSHAELRQVTLQIGA